MYGDKARLRYTDTDSFIIHIKTEDFYKDMSNDIDKWFDTSNFNKNDNRPLEIRKNKKVIGRFKDELGGKIMTEFCALRAKAYAYKLDDDVEKKKAKGNKKCVVEREIIFKNYMDSLFNNQIIIRSQQRFKSNHHNVCTEEVNKVALSSNDDKRMQTFDKITTFPYGTNVFKICENEMLLKNKFSIKDIDKDNNNQELRDKSQVLRSEAQALRNESLLVRNELHKIRNEAQVLKNESKKIRSEAKVLRNEPLIPKNESQTLRDKSQVLRGKAQALRKESLLVRNELVKISNEAQALRNKSQKIRSEAQALRNESSTLKNNLVDTENESQMLRNKSQLLRDEAQALRKESLLIRNELHKVRNEADILRNSSLLARNESQAIRNESIKPEKVALIHKRNKVVDQVNLTVKIRIDYLKNVDEIIEIMNKLHDFDDPQLRLFELKRINALLDKSLDYAWELSHGGNREKHEIIIDKDKCLNRYSDIINDKLGLVNEIGELIDSYMADAYNIMDGINKSHNNSSLCDILAQDLKNCKDTILKMINSSSVCAKQDIKKTDADNATVCDK